MWIQATSLEGACIYRVVRNPLYCKGLPANRLNPIIAPIQDLTVIFMSQGPGVIFTV